jgi:DNA-binding protein HU-beta
LIYLILSPLRDPGSETPSGEGKKTNHHIPFLKKSPKMRKADLINNIAEKTGIPKVDVLVALETMFKEVKESLAQGENIYIRGFGSFITKKRAAKIGRNIKKNTAVHIPAHFIPAFKPAKEFVQEVKKLQIDARINEEGAEEMAEAR